MFDFLIWAFIIYSVYKIVRRKLVKPNYEGKTVWITGASSGIGEFLSYEFNKYGAEVIISARNITEL
jgi:NADPH:quinone reductase-like Zn-dependent oxidoreductase